MEKTELYKQYCDNLILALKDINWEKISKLSDIMYEAWQKGKRIYICGNGGSAANAIHLANDFNYGISRKNGIGMRVIALTANSAVITCLANDISYDEIFSQQIAVQGEKGDILIVLSGSGNSVNVIRALEEARKLGMKTFAILGYDGGKCKIIAETSIHVEIDDMQISEDLQLIIGHIIMRILCENPVSK